MLDHFRSVLLDICNTLNIEKIEEKIMQLGVIGLDNQNLYFV